MFELIDIKQKYQLLKEHLTDNNLKLKVTASEWALQSWPTKNIFKNIF